MHEFWVGDWVKIKNSGAVGVYRQDIGQTEAIIEVNGKKKQVSIKDIVPTTPPQDTLSPEKPIRSKPKKIKQPIHIPREIDLHLNVLDPTNKISQHRMLDYQLEVCQNFINEARKRKYVSVLIIHGKGSGILKTSVLHYLDSLSYVQHTIEKNNGGATEVWLRY